eukprot:3902563-Prymnesium_polylepis.3
MTIISTHTEATPTRDGSRDGSRNGHGPTPVCVSQEARNRDARGAPRPSQGLSTPRLDVEASRLKRSADGSEKKSQKRYSTALKSPGPPARSRARKAGL